MISRYIYKTACKKALIPLTKTESEVLDSVTENGWFDEEAYLEAIDSTKPKIYITEHQHQIMALCPQRDEDPFTADRKNEKRKQIVKEIRDFNNRKEGVYERRRVNRKND